MTEEEQIAYAMQMSMAENEGGEGGSEEKMDVDDKDQDYSEVMNDPEFLQSVLQVNVIPTAQWYWSVRTHSKNHRCINITIIQ